jgi:hypothetical protein
VNQSIETVLRRITISEMKDSAEPAEEPAPRKTEPLVTIT